MVVVLSLYTLYAQGKLKEMTLARMPELVIKDARLPVLLDRFASTVHASNTNIYKAHFMCKVYKGLMSPYLSAMFCLNETIHPHDTRHANDFHIVLLYIVQAC